MIKTSVRDFVVECKIYVVHRNFKHFGHPPRIPSKIRSRHGCEVDAPHETKKICNKTFLSDVYVAAAWGAHFIWNSPRRVKFGQVLAVHTKPPVAIISRNLGNAPPVIGLESMAPPSKDGEVFGP